MRKASVSLLSVTLSRVVEELLQLPDVDYIEVRDLEAGCYDFRIERLNGAGEEAL